MHLVTREPLQHTSPEPPRVLVVDDEATVREVLCRNLLAGGHAVRAAASAAEALALLEQEPADLVLSDIMMPGTSGIELLRSLKARWPDTAVVMVTALSDVQAAIDALKLGAADYVVKPFTLEQVEVSVSRALEDRRVLLENRAYQARLEREVAQRREELSRARAEIEETYDATLEVLGAALDYRDSETEGHCERVTRYTVALAEAMGCSPAELKQIERGAYLHDLGKIGVPDAILLKPDKLTKEEWVVMQSHAEKGYLMLKDIPFLKEAAEIVYTHQERYDGSGYPRGLKGEEIPLGSRIFAVADTLDAMTSDRPYRRALPFSAAVAEIVRYSGTQFDPKVVEAFKRIVPTLERIYRDTTRGAGTHHD
ncbi:MAG TPA: HD domain-containing phosphohydrolase [Thermodesulfobacteriota bacterium]|nr:HD domain-containing phosphohydrolase [Thermodesulfobacteriota bacterium]